MRTLVLYTISLFILCTSCTKDDDNIPSDTVGIAGDNLLITNTQKLLDNTHIPAIAAMSMKSGTIIETVELGIQNINTNEIVLENSQWHIGSITKSMTASLVGVLVQNEYLSWDTKIGDLTTEGYLETYQNVTIHELLSMTAGITATDYPIDPEDTRPVSEIRQEWALAALNVPRENTGNFVYSNSSYIVAAVMIEMIMGETWEDLITLKLFDELGMHNTGFGAPSGNNQPWGHRRTGDSWEAKNPNTIFSDNPKALGPAGTVHTTLSDMAKYANFHLGKTIVVSQDILNVLHAEVNNSGYALGWNVNDSGIFHSGSNTNWFAQLFINLSEEFVNFSVTNSYDLEGTISVPTVQAMMGIMGQRYENSL